MKGNVGRQYTTTTTFKEVLQRLKYSFDTLQAHTVQGCISKANKNLEKLRQQIVDMEDVDNEESGSSGDSDEEESDIGDSDTED